MRQRYIDMRNSKVLDVNLIYEYALSKGFNLSFSDFNFGAQYLLVEGAFEQMDREFELTVLYDKNRNFIKVVN
jgi:uncharacterized membrane protein